MISVRRSSLIVLVLVCGSLMAAMPVEAQRDFEPLFDKFNVKLEGSWVGLTTELRLDSDFTERQGTTLNFEDDLDLASGKTIPSLSFEWQIARKHKLGVRWQDIDRRSSSQALTEIVWGDEVIPIEADIGLGFDVEQYFIDYTFYPWVKERWAAGFGIGIRQMDVRATLTWVGEGEVEEEGSTDANASAPLPYIYFEYRRLFSENWRFITGFGWLYVNLGDVEGGQWIGRAGVEYLAGNHLAFGAALNLAYLDVDWKGVDVTEGENLYTGFFKMEINDISVFARVRF